MFEQRCSISNYNMRNFRDLHIPKLNVELTKKGFHYSGIKAWNDILVNIRELPSLRLFEIHLKMYLMSLDDKFKPLKKDSLEDQVNLERVAEWLRRLTRKPKVRAAVGSNPALDSP